MGGIVMAWVYGMGLITWRFAKVKHSPPPPGDLAIASGAYMIAGVVGMADETLGNLLAWGLNAAATLNILSGTLAKPSTSPIPNPLASFAPQAQTASQQLKG